jgi:hypothetical protein
MVKDNVKVIRGTPTEGIWGSGFTAPLIINLCYRWKWVVSFTSRQIYPHPPEKDTLILIEQEAGWAPGTVLTFWSTEDYIYFGFSQWFCWSSKSSRMFSVSFGRFLPTFRWILWRLIDPEDEAATILRNEGISLPKVTRSQSNDTHDVNLQSKSFSYQESKQDFAVVQHISWSVQRLRHAGPHWGYLIFENIRSE